MTRAISLLLLSGWCAAAQQIDLPKLDFSSLDKLAAKATEVNRVSLDRDQLKAALSLLSGVDQQSKANLNQLGELVKNLTGIEVRSYEFDKPGQYRDSDLAPIRQQFGKLKDWSKIVDSKEDGERSEIFMWTEDGKTKGLAVIAAEETEVSVVFLRGAQSLKDLGALGGIMGLPTLKMGPRDQGKK